MKKTKKVAMLPKPKTEKITDEQFNAYKIVQFNINDDWISLVTDPARAEKPSISELHSIIKHSLVILEAVSGFEMVTILTKIHDDIKQNIKDRAKMLVDDWPASQVKDMYKVENDSFKMYKGKLPK